MNRRALLLAAACSLGFGRAQALPLWMRRAALPGGIMFGAKTRSGFGGYPSGNAPASAITGTGASDWLIDDEGDIVPSGTYGAVKSFSLATYVLGLANGASITISMVSDAFHVKWKNDAALTHVDTASSFQLRSVCILTIGAGGAPVLGDTIFVRNGTQNNVSTSTLGGLDMRLRLPLGGYAGSGWLKVKADNPVNLDSTAAAPAVLTRLTIDNALQISGTLDCGLWFEGFGLCRPLVGVTRTIAVFNVAHSNGTVDRLYFKSNRGYGTVINDPTGLANASCIVLSEDCSNVTIDNSIFHDLYNPIIIGSLNPTITNTTTIRSANDSYKIIAPTNPTMADLIDLDKRYPIGSGAHGDHYQQSNTTLTAGTHAGGSYHRIFLVNGNDDGMNDDGQGIFSDDQVVGAPYDGSVVENLFVLFKTVRGLSISNLQNGSFKRVGAFRDEPSSLPAGLFMVGNVNTVIEDAICSYFSQATYAPPSGGSVPSSGNTVTRVLEIDPAGNKTWAQYAALYAALFDSPSYGSANALNPNLVPTTSAIAAKVLEIKQNWAPKRGVLIASGGGMNPDGTYRGPLFPKNMDGTVDWNDGSVYVYH